MPKGDTSDLPEGCIANILPFTWAQDVCSSSLVSKMFKPFKIPKGGIPFLPEECIANILSFTSPQDACISSLVSKMFKSAAYSDVVWEKFLPRNYRRIVGHLEAIRSKKELYIRYFHRGFGGVPSNAGKTIRLTSRSINGKKCLMIQENSLSIGISCVKDTEGVCWSWGYDDWHTYKFPNPTQVLVVRWLRITGTINSCMLSPETMYAVYFVFKLTDKAYGLDHAEACVSFVEGEGRASGSCTVCLDPKLKGGVRFLDKLRASLSAVTRREKRVHFPSRRVGFWKEGVRVGSVRSLRKWENRGYCPKGWMEVKMGEFYNADPGGEVRMTLSEVKNFTWMSGLIIQGIEVRPKE